MAPPPLDEHPGHVGVRDDELSDFPSEHAPSVSSIHLNLHARVQSVRRFAVVMAIRVRATVAVLLSSRRRLHVPVIPRFHWRSLIDGRAGVAPIVVVAFLCGVTLGAVVFGDSNQPTTTPPSAAVSPAVRRARSVDLPAAAESSPIRYGRTVRSDPANVGATATTGHQVFRGSLSIDSRPSGAAVYINGRAAGRTPVRLSKQVVGSRAIRVAADGFRSSSTTVQIVTGRETRLEVELKPLVAANEP